MSPQTSSDSEFEYTKLLSKLFPSKFIKKRAKELLKKKQALKTETMADTNSKQFYSRQSKKRRRKSADSATSSDDDSSDSLASKQAQKILGKMLYAKGINIMVDIDDDEDYDDDDDDDYDEDEDDDEYEEE